MFLLVGDEKAIVIDSGIGVGDLKGFIRTLTDKPLMVPEVPGQIGGHDWPDECVVFW
jgi:hypothetical protein